MYRYDRGYIDIELVKRMLGEGAEKGLCAVRFNWRGEPLLHPRILDMVDCAKRAGILDVYVNTNALLLDKKTAEGFVEKGLDRITVSFEGWTKEVYEKYRVGSHFETVVDNVRYLAQVKRETRSANPRIRMQSVGVPEVKGDVEAYRRYWNGTADEIAVIEMRDEGGNYRGLEDDDWECPYLWLRLTVAFDGTVHPCCYVTREERSYAGWSGIGNAGERSIEDLWRSTIMSDLRERHGAGLSHTIPICDHCSFRGTDILSKRGNG
jgi:MoaA/NifB/PqqE/SkfB family radical SAM enzyme